MNIATGKLEDLSIEGRHDTCIALRVPVVVEAAAAIVMADFAALRASQKSIKSVKPIKSRLRRK
jgi:chorismate synthase